MVQLENNNTSLVEESQTEESRVNLITLIISDSLITLPKKRDNNY